ncbi:MAG: hypothetical protein JW722_01090 [Demequinaceae bacterium]|nr:hypothetical protein [Demequinaceae bacterium]
MAPDDVFASRSGARIRSVDDVEVDAYQAGIHPQYSYEGTAVIDIPGASLPVTLIGLNRFSPTLLVGGKKARFKFPGKWIVPMADGSEVYLRMWNYPFGYVRLKRDGVTVFEEPRPRGIDMFLLWALFIAPFLSLKYFLAGPVGILSQWGAGIWLKKPSPSPLTKRLVLGGIVVLEIVFAILLLLLIISMLS